MKKIVTMLVLALLIACLSTTAFAASAGDTVTIEFTSVGNPGFGSYNATISYNTEVLQLVEVKEGALTSGKGFFVWGTNAAFMGLSDATGDGVLFTATFKVLDTAKVGQTYDVTAALIAGSAMNNAGQAVSFDIKGGSVKIDCPHANQTTLDAVAATCTEPGLTEGKKCADCGEVIVAQTEVKALGHKEVKDAAVAPTCTETGLTEGKHCERCNEVLVAQTVVDALGHDYKGVVTKPTCTEDGYTTYTCANCGDKYTDDVVAATGHNYQWKHTKKEHWQQCSNCGEKTTTGAHDVDENGICKVCGRDTNKDDVPGTGDITPVIVTTVLAMAAAVTGAAYMLKRKFTV